MSNTAESREPAAAELDLDDVRAVADAILYEGYLLYPYRKSSPKNRVRWQFGILAPRRWVEWDGPIAESVAGSVESWQQQTECLLEVEPAEPERLLRVRVRFLQLQAKTVERRTDDGYEPVESLDVGDARYLSFDEAVPRECDFVVSLPELLADGRSFPIQLSRGEQVEPLDDDARIVRRRWPVEATVTLAAEHLDAPRAACKLRVRTENTVSTVVPTMTRAEALRYSLIATHTLLRGRGLRFLSQIEPPEWVERHAAACRNTHTFPVLTGDLDVADSMLSSPILLYDYPQIAPESPGDLHDAAEIDEILSLRTMTLTEDEKREARATDPRAAEILDRVDDMPEEVMAKLHGAVRDLRPNPTTKP
ncbi:hypothetical protein [Haloechinothrix salitolerans]|uniref:Uncharacterized protein n=1 Tax=Haloechinothrix salitolerans TaxID=926830 RepID=A0ABW2C390_9PSEU